MARQGSLCQQVQSARSKFVASGLRFVLTLTSLVLITATTWGESTDPAETAASPIQIRGLSPSVVSIAESAIDFSAAVENFTDYASSRLILRASLLRSSDGEVVQSHREIVAIDSQGNGQPLAFQFVAPQQIGIYEIRLDLTKDEGDKLWDRFRWSKPPLVQTGKPLMVVTRASTTLDRAEPETNSQPKGEALLRLADLSWIETLIASEPYRPSSDDDFQITADRLTKRAQRLWIATQRLAAFIEASGLAGAIIEVDSDGKAWAAADDQLQFPVESNDIDHRINLETLLAVMRSHSMDVTLVSTDEVPLVSLNRSENLPGQPTEVTSMPHDAELAIARVIDSQDPQRLAIQVALDGTRLSEPVEQMLQTFSDTPVAKLKAIPPTDAANSTVRVRSAMDGQRGYVSVLNLAPWQSYVDLEFDQKISWSLVGRISADPNVLRQSESRPSHVRLSLSPGELVLLRSESDLPAVSIETWSASVGGGTEQVAQIKQDVTSIVERIGLLTDLESSNSLSNGGFEQTGGIGLVGWMHAQHPPGCVQIDSTESMEGEKSVLLTADPMLSSRTWIVSETIEPPESGRLAVSLVMRAEKHDSDPPHPMRVAIEATGKDGPVRYSADFEVPRNGQWGSRQIVLETSGVAKQDVESLRLTIDSLAGGRVWLDDVRIHQWFPTAMEREQLQSLAFLAVQGLQNGNLAPAAQLLQNRWARYLLSRGPAKVVKPAAVSTPPDRQPGVAERIRSWLPKPIRF